MQPSANYNQNTISFVMKFICKNIFGTEYQPCCSALNMLSLVCILPTSLYHIPANSPSTWWDAGIQVENLHKVLWHWNIFHHYSNSMENLFYSYQNSKNKINKNFAHAMTAWLSWHVQNFYWSDIYVSNYSKTNFPSIFSFGWQIISKMYICFML